MALDPLTAGADLLSSGLNYLSTQKTNESNERLMRDQMSWQEQMMDKQNAINDPKYQADRMRAAGLNPALGQGTTPIESHASAGVQGVSAPQLVAPQFDFGRTIQLAFQNSKTDADRKLTEENAKVVAPLAESTQKLQASQSAESDAHAKNYLEQINVYKAQSDKLISATLKDFEEMKNLSSERMLNFWRGKILRSEASHKDEQMLSEIGVNNAQIEELYERKLNLRVDSGKKAAEIGLIGEQANKEHFLGWQAKCSAGIASLDYSFLSQNPLAVQGRHFANFLNVSQVIYKGGKPTDAIWSANNPLQAAMIKAIDDKNKREWFGLNYTITKDAVKFFTGGFRKASEMTTGFRNGVMNKIGLGSFQGNTQGLPSQSNGTFGNISDYMSW